MQKLKRKINNLLFGRYKHSLSNSKSTSVRSLDRLNLSLGDVRDVFEPYLAIFLASDRHWNPAQVGIALSTTSIAGILAETPTGALVDASRHKRLMIATARVAVAISYMVQLFGFACCGGSSGCHRYISSNRWPNSFSYLAGSGRKRPFKQTGRAQRSI